MTETDDITITPAGADDHDALVARFEAAMHSTDQPDDNQRALFEPDRALLARDGDTVIGTALTYGRDLSVPGAIVQAAHVTDVSVAATHRRRGVLTRLMRRQLTELPESVAALWASEPGIYGRFGYAMAGRRVRYRADLARARPLPVGDLPGRLREIPAESAAAVLAPILRDHQAHRPGVSGRTHRHWAVTLADPVEQRHGATARRIVVHESADGTPDGYLLWRGRSGWGDTGADSTVVVEELVAVDRHAYRSLWNYVLTLDLVTTVIFDFAAVDEPVRHLLGNPRALRPSSVDALWLRLVNVPAALTQRRYSASADLVLDVVDEFLPANHGRFRFTVDTATARCVPTTDRADVTLPVSVLAAAYLGAVPPTEYAVTGEVRAHTVGAVETLATAFGWPVAPGSLEIF